MKNLSLFVTLGLISLMGAFTAVNAQTPTEIPSENVEVEQEEVLVDEFGNPIIQDETVEVPTDEEAADAADASDAEPTEMPAQ